MTSCKICDETLKCDDQLPLLKSKDAPEVDTPTSSPCFHESDDVLMKNICRTVSNTVETTLTSAQSRPDSVVTFPKM